MVYILIINIEHCFVLYNTLHLFLLPLLFLIYREYIAALPNGSVAKLRQLQGQPCGFAATQREVVFTLGNTSYFADETGKVLSREPITWRGSPTSVAVSGSHILALVPEGLEVQLSIANPI